MEYRRLGRTGLRVSLLSYGTWLTFTDQEDDATLLANLTVARQAGINLFDTADGYGHGMAEARLGAALQLLRWPRESYLLCTKLYLGTESTLNLHHTLNRKYLLHAIDASLQRLRTPFVDLLLCHRPDPDTSLEDIVWTLSDIVAAGKAHCWGTSQWPPELVAEAGAVADRLRLRRPAVEQPEYSLVHREPFESGYAPLADTLGLGLMTWSPLASGLLSGKYAGPQPDTGRASLPGCEWLAPALRGEAANRAVAPLVAMAASMGVTPAQLAVAWCASHSQVSTVILGASRPEQLRENLGALDLLPQLTPEVRARLAHAMP
jgi:voltage-dependent potassium channel beta subunit